MELIRNPVVFDDVFMSVRTKLEVEGKNTRMVSFWFMASARMISICIAIRAFTVTLDAELKATVIVLATNPVILLRSLSIS